MNLTSVSYKVLFNNKDITRDISDHLLSISYVDKVEGESDEIEIELEDRDALWQNEWLPAKGDTIEVQIIQNDAILKCGKFTLDEKTLRCSRDGGDEFVIAGLAASITKKLRSKRWTAHENKSLKQLAQTVADRHGLTVVGAIPDIRFSRITQNKETDLAFLNRIAAEYGLLFSIRDTQLIFQLKTELEGKAHIISLDKTEVTEFEFLDKTENTFAESKVKYHNPEKNAVYEYTDAGGDGFDSNEIRSKVENSQQAEHKAKAAQHKKNTRTLTCTVTCPGNVLLMSGVNVEMTGFGKFSCIAHITECTHKISRSDGYTVTFEGKKVNVVASSKYKPKRKGNNAGFWKQVLSVTGSQEVPREEGLSLGTAIEALGTGVSNKLKL